MRQVSTKAGAFNYIKSNNKKTNEKSLLFTRDDCSVCVDSIL